MTPESVGVSDAVIVIVTDDVLEQKIIELGYDIGDNAIEESFNNFKALADKKKNVYDEDIIAIIDDQVIRVNDHITLKDLSVIAGTKGPQTAEVSLLIDENEHSIKSEGDGPVDAIFKCIKVLFRMM